MSIKYLLKKYLGSFEKRALKWKIPLFFSKFNFRWSCLIADDESFILTGGLNSETTVTRYNMSGFQEDLPTLLHGRMSHGCSQYVSDNGNKVNIVAGGWDGQTRLDSSEMSEQDSQWSLISSLPQRLEFLSGLTLGNEVLMFGKEK